MDEPVSQQEETEERTVTPADVWEQLSPDVQERACSLLRRMAYKYALAQRGSLSEETEVRGEIQGDESQDHN
jgi:hypothetical protein